MSFDRDATKEPERCTTVRTRDGQRCTEKVRHHGPHHYPRTTFHKEENCPGHECLHCGEQWEDEEKMRAFTITLKNITDCPITSLSPSHYREDGSCRCDSPWETFKEAAQAAVERAYVALAPGKRSMAEEWRPLVGLAENVIDADILQACTTHRRIVPYGEDRCPEGIGKPHNCAMQEAVLVLDPPESA